MKQNATRDKIIAYVSNHPSATLRAIQAACGVSSPSVVKHHLDQIKRHAAECPICKGKGRLPEPNTIERDRAAERKRMATTLRDAGYSMRQIQDFIGWKSVRSVSEDWKRMTETTTTNKPTEPPAGQPDRMMQFFAYAHLPPHLQVISKPFGDLAKHMVETLPMNPERTAGLRKLLEAKDCAVRAQLFK